MLHHHEPADVVIADLDSDIHLGLSAHQAEQRLIQYNELIDAGKWISHLTAVVLVMQQRMEEIHATMIARDGLKGRIAVAV